MAPSVLGLSLARTELTAPSQQPHEAGKLSSPSHSGREATLTAARDHTAVTLGLEEIKTQVLRTPAAFPCPLPNLCVTHSADRLGGSHLQKADWKPGSP